MKKIYMLSAAFAMAAMFSGCIKENLQVPQTEGTVITAGISQTRTALDGVKVNWTNGDKIVVNGATSAALVLDAPAGTATFTIDANLEAPYRAVYPASIFKDESTVTLPDTQEYGGESSFDSETSPMLAFAADGSNIHFTHPFAIVKVAVKMNGKSATIKTIEFRGNDGEQVCGDFDVDYMSLALSGKGANDSNTSVKVNINKSLADGETCTAYIVVPARTYSSGYTVKVVDDQYNSMEKSTSARTLEKGQLNAMTPFDFEPTGTSAPTKVALGVSSTTPTLVWKKSLSTIDGIQNVLNVNGVAVTNEYVLLSENGNSNPVYLNALTGEKIGTYDASTITAVSPEYYATTDDLGKLCFSTYSDAADEKLNIYVARSFTSAPELIYTRDGDATRRQGYKISVFGECVMGANICIPVYASASAGSKYIANVRVVSSNNKFVGTWQGPNLNIGATQGWAQTWGTMCDAMMIASTNYAAGSGARVLTTAGATKNSNTVAELTLSTYSGSAWSLTTTKTLEDPGKKFSTALDYIIFNGNEYIVYNYVNSAANLNGADGVRLIDMTADATLNTEYRVTGNHIHGAWYESGKTVANSNCLGDVAFQVSADGYYLYVYLVFAGGDVACYRYDCIAK